MHTQLESRPVDCHILAAGYTYPGGAAASWQHLRAWVRDGRWRLRTQRLCILLHQHIRLYWIPNRRCGIWCYKQRYLFVGYRIAFRIPEGRSADKHWKAVSAFPLRSPLGQDGGACLHLRQRSPAGIDRIPHINLRAVLHRPGGLRRLLLQSGRLRCPCLLYGRHAQPYG